MRVCKEYIGMMPVTQTNADTIIIYIKDVLLHMNLRIQDTHGQCYDGYSTKTGNKIVVSAQIRKLKEKCLLMHCYCFSNLAVRDTIKNIRLLKDTLDTAYEVTKLIKKSPIREAEFYRKQAEFLGKWNVISMYTIWTHQL